MTFLQNIMSVAKYLALFLILCNIPSYLTAYFDGPLGSIASYLSSLLLVFYFFFSKEKHKPLYPFILLGILYFMIGSLSYSSATSSDPIIEFIRFSIVTICAGEILYRTTKKELFLILIIGAFSIIINAVIFPLANANFYPTYGRYSGFYLNPNFAGAMCIIGFALSYAIKKKSLRTFGQLVFTFAGILTFSRSFIVIWLIVNVISIYNDRKNITVPLIGLIGLLVVFALSSILSLNQDRFSALVSIFKNDTTVKTKTITDDSRSGTWALYSDLLAENALFGEGYNKMQAKRPGLPGIHNSFLMVLGEAGIFPFLLIVWLHLYILFNSLKVFKIAPENFYLSCVLILVAMIAHGYFDNFYNVIISMFLFIQIRQYKINTPNNIQLKTITELPKNR